MTSGEILAQDFADSPEKYAATPEQISHYIKYKGTMESHRKKNGGIIGVRNCYKGGVESYSVRIPPENRVVYFRNGLQAAMFFNSWVKHHYQDHAILCDMQAAIAKFVYKREKNMPYSITHEMVKNSGMSWIEDINATSVAEIINSAIRQGIVGPPTWHIESGEKSGYQVFTNRLIAERIASHVDAKVSRWEG